MAHLLVEVHTAEVAAAAAAAAAEKAPFEPAQVMERNSGLVCAGSSVVEGKLHDVRGSMTLLGP